ncbi:(d)CMP kinase [Desulfovibrio inopinatus]|uniref:(d)CMP kinase n=1 Tax=Desulfovibrio inopinatus TaxID=102109 RepID=UPI0003F5EAF6|nr:(d)CMP kinase [Desulfovibrio inopinatus]
MIVTIDGPAGVGKTTLASKTASYFHLTYLDTGAMFRSAALALGPGVHELPETVIAAALSKLDYTLQGTGPDAVLLLNGVPLSEDIRTEEAGNAASALAKSTSVRSAMVKAQRRMAQHGNLVAEGRDMGTVVFPEAECKIFLDADPAIRAQRRFLQLQAMNKPADLQRIEQQVRARDERDRNRAIAPLKPADDAVIIDTSTLDIDGVFRAIVHCVESVQS